jgi:hypothetical protein
MPFGDNVQKDAASLVEQLRKFADECEQTVARDNAKISEAKTRGLTCTGLQSYVDWTEGKASAYRLAAMWLARDVLGLEE